MTTVFEAVKSLFAAYTDDEPKSPLHVGEVMNLWTYHAMLTEINRYAEVGLNMTRDEDLIKMLRNSVGDCSKHVSEIELLFKEEGIPLPPSPEPKPKSNPDEVPPGAKLTDSELANGISAKQVLAILSCANGVASSLRLDVGEMWVRFFLDRVKFNAYFGPLMRKRGWMKVPPMYCPPGRPTQ